MIYVISIAGIEEKLLFYTSGILKEIDLETGVVKPLTTQNTQAYSMAYDHKERYIYLPRYSIGDIVR